MIHDAALYRLEVVVGFWFNTSVSYKAEEYVQSDLKLAWACLGQSRSINLENPLSLPSNRVTVRGLFVFLIVIALTLIKDHTSQTVFLVNVFFDGQHTEWVFL